MEASELKGKPIKLFWDHASCWRKLALLRLLDALKEDLAQKYLKEMARLQNRDGGFPRKKGEASRVTETAEAIINLVKSGGEPSSQRIQRAIDFLWSLQKENGSWRENPELPKEKVPFWSSREKGVPILTADSVEALVEAGYKRDLRVLNAIKWLLGMQSPSGMWLSIEGADPKDVEPDSTQRAISALMKFGMQASSPEIRKACAALENFIRREAEEWARIYPPVWPWVAALDGLIAAGYTLEKEVVRLALKKILEQQEESGGWLNKYELRVVPTLVAMKFIPKGKAWECIKMAEGQAIT